MAVVCEYCGKSFASQARMSQHQVRAQYCKALQGKEATKYVCFCGKSYTLKSSLQRHQKTCSVNDNNILLKLLEAVSAKPAQTANESRIVNMQNLTPITEDDLKKHLKHLTLRFIQDGAKGYASYAGEYPFKNKVLCTDRSRKKLRYKQPDGMLTDDSKELARRFFSAISDHNTEILSQEYSILRAEVKAIVESQSAGTSNITEILSKASTFQDLMIKVQNAAEGKDDTFAQEFLSHLSKIL